MSSLWTPEGEHRVESERSTPARAFAPPSGEATGAQQDVPSRDELRQEMARLEQELVEAPVEDVVMNHCYGLFQLAALHLNQQPPNLEAARFATDALALLVEGLGDRLGEHSATLKEGLTSIRLAYVQIAGTSARGAGAASSTPGDQASSKGAGD